MHLKLKENCTFTNPKNKVSRTATAEDYPVLSIYNLELKSEDFQITATFYVLIYWDSDTSVDPFYVGEITLSPDEVAPFTIIPVPDGVTEIDLVATVQRLIYNYLLANQFLDWELVEDD